MHWNVSRVRVAAVALSLLFAVVGCEPKRVDVTGKITYNGAPLDKTGGKIVFVGSNGAQVAADIGPDGSYMAEKVVVGANQVAIYYVNPELKKGRRFPVKGEAPPPPSPSVEPFLTPSHYASVETSKLTAEIQEGVAFNADLEGPKIR